MKHTVLLLHLCQLRDVNCVPREEYRVWLAISLSKRFRCQDEASDLTTRKVDARGSSNLKSLSLELDRNSLPDYSISASVAISERKNKNQPRLQSFDTRPRSKVLCSVRGGEHDAAFEKTAARLVKIVDMVLVAQENSIDRREIGKA